MSIVFTDMRGRERMLQDAQSILTLQVLIPVSHSMSVFLLKSDVVISQISTNISIPLGDMYYTESEQRNKIERNVIGWERNGR
jgi:hypothetical protein